jgi:hypothetical protein
LQARAPHPLPHYTRPLREACQAPNT